MAGSGVDVGEGTGGGSVGVAGGGVGRAQAESNSASSRQSETSAERGRTGWMVFMDFPSDNETRTMRTGAGLIIVHMLGYGVPVDWLRI